MLNYSCIPGINPTSHFISSVQFTSVTQLCPTICDPMDCSTPGLPVHHQLPELAQTHINRVSDAIQLHLLLLLPSIFPSTRVFSKESVLRNSWPKYWSFYFSSVLPMNIQDWFPLNWLGWSPCHPRVSEESSPTLQFKSINSSALSFLLDMLN